MRSAEPGSVGGCGVLAVRAARVWSPAWRAAAEGFDPDVGVAAAQFGVGGDGAFPGGGGGGLPGVVSGLGLGRAALPGPRTVCSQVACTAASCSSRCRASAVSAASALRRARSASISGAADLPAHQGQLVALVLRRPGHFPVPGVAPGPQLPVAVLAHLAGHVAERLGGGLPHGAGLRRVIPGPGTDRLVRVDVTPHLPVGGDQGCLVLPFRAVHRVIRHRPEGVRPGGRVLGGVLAQAPGPVVHRLRELAGVPAGARVAGVGHLLGPGPGGQGGHACGLLPDAPVQHLGHRVGVVQRAPLDGAAQCGRPVQPGRLGLAQRPPYPRGGRVVHDMPDLVTIQAGPRRACS